MNKLTLAAVLLIACVRLAMAQGTYTQIDDPGALDSSQPSLIRPGIADSLVHSVSQDETVLEAVRRRVVPNDLVPGIDPKSKSGGGDRVGSGCELHPI